MRYEIHSRLFVGDENECPHIAASAFGVQANVLHACKDPCFVRANKGHPLTPDDPTYLSIERAPDLYLNLIDPPTPLFYLRSFLIALSWLEERMTNKTRWPRGEQANILIHCNAGASRSPSIAMLWLARHRFIVPDTYARARDSYHRLAIEATRAALGGITPYAPGVGIAIFLETHWKELVP